MRRVRPFLPIDGECHTEVIQPLWRVPRVSETLRYNDAGRVSIMERYSFPPEADRGLREEGSIGRASLVPALSGRALRT